MKALRDLLRFERGIKDEERVCASCGRTLVESDEVIHASVQGGRVWFHTTCFDVEWGFE
jgi:hypothetical protein